VKPKKARRVLIVGARGALGRLTVRAFQAAGWEVQRGIRTPAADGDVCVALERIDSVRTAAREHELIINTVPDPDLLIERAVLEYGGALINVSALPAAASRALRAVAGGAHGTVILNAGFVPGVSNLVAADLLRAHPEADELELVLTISTRSTCGPAGVAFVDHGLRVLSRHRTSVVPLPEPFGSSDCVGFSEDDAGWLGGVAEGRVVRVYVRLSEREAQQRLLAQNSAGAMTAALGCPMATRTPAFGHASREPVAHWIAAKRRGCRLAARTLECAGHYEHAARCALVFAETLLDAPRSSGCFDPEEVFTLDELTPSLARSGISTVPQPVGAAAAG
jgi:NAD(P)-dependent dehydrogenase (short-subunit alcohol dehydrogenase family)